MLVGITFVYLGIKINIPALVVLGSIIATLGLVKFIVTLIKDLSK